MAVGMNFHAVFGKLESVSQVSCQEILLKSKQRKEDHSGTGYNVNDFVKTLKEFLTLFRKTTTFLPQQKTSRCGKKTILSSKVTSIPGNSFSNKFSSSDRISMIRNRCWEKNLAKWWKMQERAGWMSRNVDVDDAQLVLEMQQLRDRKDSKNEPSALRGLPYWDNVLVEVSHAGHQVS